MNAKIQMHFSRLFSPYLLYEALVNGENLICLEVHSLLFQFYA